MQRIDKDTVRLNDREHAARHRFHALLDYGMGVLDAAAKVEELHPGLDPAFYAWLRK